MTTPVIKVSGIGPKTAAFLQQRGVESVEALLAAGSVLLAEAPGFGAGRVERVMAAAAALLESSAVTPARDKSGKTKKGRKGKGAGKVKKRQKKNGKEKKAKKDKKRRRDKKDKKDKKKKKKK